MNRVRKSRIIWSRHSWAALFWLSSRWSGTPTVLRRLGDEPALPDGLLSDGLSERPDAGRWNSDGARHTARLLGVIWLIDARAATSVRNARNVCSASRCSSGSRSTAQRRASRRWFTGTTAKSSKCFISYFKSTG